MRHDSPHPDLRIRRRRPRRAISELPENLRPITAETRREGRRWLRLPLAVLLIVAGLLLASIWVDHCAQDARFCAQPSGVAQPPLIEPPTSAPQTASLPARTASDGRKALDPGARPVLGQAFEPLPLSLSDQTTRSFVLPPGRTMLDMATEVGRISVDEISLIAVVHQDGARHALVRLPDGRILRLQQGDTLDGGTVAAIGEDALYLLGPDLNPRALLLGG